MVNLNQFPALMIKHHFNNPLSFDLSINWVSVFLMVLTISVSGLYGTLLGVRLGSENPQQVLGSTAKAQNEEFSLNDGPPVSVFGQDFTEPEVMGEEDYLPVDEYSPDDETYQQEMESFYDSQQETVESLPYEENKYPSYDYQDDY